ncbi:MAG: hypothetical protein K2L12_00205 [Clostridia bacterium]|nr:hypothetical protein [Clostridia bacterium]
MKISMFYGKNIISRSGMNGYVICVYAEGLKLCSLVCADENEKKFEVDFKNLTVTKGKLIFKESKPQICGQPLRLGKPVFDYEGNYLGKLTDLSFEKDELTFAHVGKCKFSVNDIVLGDAVIVKNSARILKSNVKKNGRVIIKRGTPLTPDIILKAQKQGEYVQTNLKTI